ncbi:MAG: nucleotidyltransferase family protein [Bacteroidia bacterium]|nr:nucleotidyltransferase family protein [Bacteroidia bacterium]
MTVNCDSFRTLEENIFLMIPLSQNSQTRMLDRDKILAKLKQIKPHLKARYSLKAIGLFGSYARNEATPDCGIDILVEFNGPVGWEIMDLTLELDELFGQEIGLVTRNAIQGRNVEASINRDLVTRKMAEPD